MINIYIYDNFSFYTLTLVNMEWQSQQESKVYTPPSCLPSDKLLLSQKAFIGFHFFWKNWRQKIIWFYPNWQPCTVSSDRNKSFGQLLSSDFPLISKHIGTTEGEISQALTSLPKNLELGDTYEKDGITYQYCWYKGLMQRRVMEVENPDSL